VTRDAFLAVVGERSYWFPKSVVQSPELVCEPPNDEAQTIDVKRWFAEKEEIPTLEDD
jgi:hypothetical protein